jgi:hypothetical protein
MNPAELTGLELKFGGRLVEQLGAQMYPSATSTVAELISNAWDADAQNVWVQMPFSDWKNGEIIVTDDGVGMDLTEARDAYLVVGRNRRVHGGQRSAAGRPVHGRKGIGKLAAFGTATILELKSLKAEGSEVAFRLDYDAIRTREPDDPYQVEQSEDAGPLANAVTLAPLAHGTRIRLTGLRLKKRLDPEPFQRSMERRFAINDHEMAVFINDRQLRRFNLDMEIRFPPGKLPPGAAVEGEWAVETLTDGHQVRWWIGFTAKPLKGEADQGISVLARGKLAQRPFKFETNTGGGTTGQLGQEYLLGEIVADWIDDDSVAFTDDRDLIQSNRDQLQLEDEYLEPFLEWGRKRLRWALETRNEMRRRGGKDRWKDFEPMDRLLRGRPKREQDALRRVADAVSRLPEADDSQVVRVMEAVINSRVDETARDLTHDIILAGGEGPSALWPLVVELAELDGASTATFLDARLETLGQLRGLEATPDLRDTIRELMAVGPGLLEPTWDLCDINDLGEIAPGVNGLLVSPTSPSDAPRLFVVADTGTDSIESALGSLADAYPGVLPTVVSLGDQTSVLSRSQTAMSWDEFIARSEDRHRGWLGLVRARIERARAR